MIRIHADGSRMAPRRSTPALRKPFITIDRVLPLLQAYYLEYFNRPEDVDLEGYFDLVKLLERTVRGCSGTLPTDLSDSLRTILERNVLAIGRESGYVVSESELGLTVLPAA